MTPQVVGHAKVREAVKVLVIEDSERLRRSLQHGLHKSGFAIDVASDGEDGLAFAQHGHYDAIVLDLMLPRLDGLSVLRRLRAEGNDAHVLVLSARDTVAERVEGLQVGADDYVTKPFDFDELVARLRTLIRRKFGSKSPVHSIGTLTVDTGRRSVYHDTTEIPMTKSEFAVLEYLLARRGRVVAKSELVDHIYAGIAHGSANSIEVLVHQLRKKLRTTTREDVIQTRRGHGYLID